MHLCSFQTYVMTPKVTSNWGFYDLRHTCHLQSVLRSENKSDCLVRMRICPATLIEKGWECGSLKTNPSPFCRPCLSDHAQILKQNSYIVTTTEHLTINVFFSCLISEIISESSLGNAYQVRPFQNVPDIGQGTICVSINISTWLCLLSQLIREPH